MASRSTSPQPAARGAASDSIAAESPPDLAQAALAEQPSARDWPRDDLALVGEVLRCHGLGEPLSERLLGFAAAPTHAKHAIERLTIALGAHFNFLPLEDALHAPMLLAGPPGAGTSTLAAKLAARFDAGEVLVVHAGRDAARGAALAEWLEALDLPLVTAGDARALRQIVAGAAGRKIVIDAAASPLDAADAKRLRELADAAGAETTLVLSAECDPGDAVALAHAAGKLGTRKVIVTRLDAARYLGGVLAAADAAGLALVAASVTPQFGFGLRAVTPENLARRLIAALHAERWRIAPF